MRLKDYWESNWPPVISVNVAPKSTVLWKANLADVIVEVQNRSPGELEIRLRRREYVEYTVFLHVPPSLQKKIIREIVRKRNMTLGEIGELPVPESS